MPLEGREKRVFEWFSKQSLELEEKANKNGGRLRRDDIWRREYYPYPYLILEPDEVILQRFSDIFTNCIDLSKDGKITPTPMMEKDARLAQFFTEITEETNWRGILHRESINQALEQITAYFENGLPLGARIFKGLPKAKSNHLYKFSKKKYVEKCINMEGFKYHQRPTTRKEVICVL